MLPRSYRHALVRAHLCHPPAGLSHGALNFFYSFSSFSKRGLCLSSWFLLLIFGPWFGFWFKHSFVPGGPTAIQLSLAQRWVLQDASWTFLLPGQRPRGLLRRRALPLSHCPTCCLAAPHSVLFPSRRWHDPSIVVTRPILVVTLSRNRACSRSHLLWTVPGLRGRIIIHFTRIRTLPCLLVSTLTIQSMIRRSVSQPPRHFELATWRGLQVEPLLQQHTLKQCSCIEPRALHIIYIWFIYLCLSSYLSIYLFI